MHEVLVNRLGGLSLPRKSVIRLTDRPDMTLDVDRGRKTTIQQRRQFKRMGPKIGTPHAVNHRAISSTLIMSPLTPKQRGYT